MCRSIRTVPVFAGSTHMRKRVTFAGLGQSTSGSGAYHKIWHAYGYGIGSVLAAQILLLLFNGYVHGLF